MSAFSKAAIPGFKLALESLLAYQYLTKEQSQLVGAIYTDILDLLERSDFDLAGDGPTERAVWMAATLAVSEDLKRRPV